MRWTVVIAGALLPAPVAAGVPAAAAAPWLAAALARARTEDVAMGGPCAATHLDWLWRQFGGEGLPVTAPYALRALAADAEAGAQCWEATPVHFEFARDHLLVAPLDAPLEADEQVALAAPLHESVREFAGPDARLHTTGGRWFLALPRPWSVRATPLDAALGQSVHEHWPEGPEARLWRRLLTDVQMRWHESPVNTAREARGARAVNALWLHGGGACAALPARPFAAVADDDPALRGWALAAGLPRAALHGAGAAVRDDAVSIRRDLLGAAQSDSWGQWLDRLAGLDAELRALQSACFAAGGDELALVLCGRQRARIARLRRGDALRLWRRPSAALLEEAE